MKKGYLILTLLIAIFINNSFAQKTKFYLKSFVGGLKPKELEGIPTYFSTLLNDYLTEKYSCATLLTSTDVGTMLDQERQRELLAFGSDETIKSISEALGVNYLVTLEVSVVAGDNFIVTSTIIPMRTKPPFPIVRASAYSNYSRKSFDNIDANLSEVAKKIVDGLKKIEICPFKGFINIKIVSTTKDKKKEEYPVYCNKTDGMYRKTTTIDNYSENDWKIEKTGKNFAKGDVKFSLSEETTIEEENSCFECSPTKQGPRTYYDKTTTFANVQGLSNESESYGIKVDDASVEITFLDNDTYTIRVKAASKQGEKKTKKEVHAEGVCNNITNKPETITNKLDEGINEIFGPFKGNAQDKVLSEKETIKKIDNDSKEESTITYEFNLKRD